MLPGSELHTDLIASAGHQTDPKKGQTLRKRLRPVCQLRLLYALSLTLHDEYSSCTSVFKEQIRQFTGTLKLAVRDREILFFKRTRCDLPAQIGRGFASAGIYHHAADIPIQTMHAPDRPAGLFRQ